MKFKSDPTIVNTLYNGLVFGGFSLFRIEKVKFRNFKKILVPALPSAEDTAEGTQARLIL